MESMAGLDDESFAYTSPELLLGVSNVLSTVEGSLSADVWSLGCSFAEMLTGTRVFDGVDAADTLLRIVQITSHSGCVERDLRYLRTLSPELPDLLGFPARQPVNLVDLIDSDVPSSFLDFLSSMLLLNPARRASASKLLDSPFVCEQLAEKYCQGLIRVQPIHAQAACLLSTRTCDVGAKSGAEEWWTKPVPKSTFAPTSRNVTPLDLGPPMSLGHERSSTNFHERNDSDLEDEFHESDSATAAGASITLAELDMNELHVRIEEVRHMHFDENHSSLSGSVPDAIHFQFFIPKTSQKSSSVPLNVRKSKLIIDDECSVFLNHGDLKAFCSTKPLRLHLLATRSLPLSSHADTFRLGTTHIDLAPLLSSAFAEVRGWYHLQPAWLGQVKVRIFSSRPLCPESSPVEEEKIDNTDKTDLQEFGLNFEYDELQLGPQNFGGTVKEEINDALSQIREIGNGKDTIQRNCLN